MRKHTGYGSIFLALLVTALAVVIGCGPAATATPTAAPAPTATTAAVATATPTRPAATTPGTTPAATTPATTVTTAPVATATPTKAAVPATPTPAAQPKKGGTFSFTINSLAPHHDQQLLSTSPVYYPWMASSEALVEVDPDKAGEFIPVLAESWTVSADGTTLTFNIRKNVKWHDGKPLTSADVVATFERIRNPPAGIIPFRKSWFATVTSITAPDANTVVMKMSSPDPGMLLKLSTIENSIMPKELLDANLARTQIVGTGPYKIKTKEAQNYQYERNSDYWQPGKPHMDALVLYFISDLDTAFSALRTDKLTAYGMDQEMDGDRQMIVKEQYKGKIDMQTIAGSGSLREIVVHWDLPDGNPFKDIRVRQALALALDKKDAAAVGYNGLVTTWGPATVHIRSAWAPTDAELRAMEPLGYTDKPMAQRITEAKKLLADAGYPNGFKTEMLVRNHPRWIPMATYAKDAFSKIGIDMSLNVLENTAAQAKAKETRGFVLFIGSGPAGDPFIGWPNRLLPGAGFNFGNRIDQPIIDLYGKLLKAPTYAEQRVIVLEGEKHVLSEYYRQPIGSDEVVAAYQSYLKGWKVGDDSKVWGRRLRDAWIEK